MEITIKGEAKEIADFVKEVQSGQNVKHTDQIDGSYLKTLSDYGVEIKEC